MYHSIIFGERDTWDDIDAIRKNSYDDWHLVSQTRPFFSPPKPKTKYVEIPGANGSIDMSESLTGYPVFEDRTGTFEFTVLNDYASWIDIYSDMMAFLNGKDIRAYLEDDPGYFYEGKFYVSNYKPGSSQSSPRAVVTVSYTVDPYKWRQEATTDDWKWDPFNFENGVIYPALFKDIDVKDETNWIKKTYTNRDYEYAPIYPELTVNAETSIDVRFVNPKLKRDITKHYVQGTTVIMVPDFIFYGDKVELYFKGKGTISIKMRNGRL